MSRGYRMLGLALVAVLAVLGLSRIIDPDSSAGLGAVSASVLATDAANTNDAPPVAASTTSSPASSTASSTTDGSVTDPGTESSPSDTSPDASVSEPVDGDVAPAVSPTTQPPASGQITDADCPASVHGAVVDRVHQRGALCANGAVTYRFPFTSAWSQPDPGTYKVYAKDLHASSTLGGHLATMTHFVAFTYGKFQGARIAFHSVPKLTDGSYAQPLSSVGSAAMRGQSHGCLRVLPDDSVRIWNWLSIGDKVHVVS